MAVDASDRPLVSKLQRMLDACKTVASQQTLDGTLRAIIESAVDILDADYGAIALWRKGAIEEFVHAGIRPATARRLGRFPSYGGLLAAVSRQRAPLLLDDLRLHPAFRGFPPGHPEMVRFAGVSLPKVRESRRGALYLARGAGRSPFTAADGQALHQLGAHACHAVRGAESREALATLLLRTALRHAIVRLSSSARDLGQIAADAIRLLAAHISAHDAELWLVSEDGARLDLVVVSGDDRAAALERTAFQKAEGIPGVAWSEGEPVFIEDISSDQRFIRSEMIRAGLHGFAAFPLKHGGEVLAVFCCAYKSAGRPPGPDLDLIEEVGSEIAQLIRTHRAEEQLRKSEARHRALVEQLPLGAYTARRDESGAWALVYTSPQFETLFALRPAPCTFQDWINEIHPEDRDGVLEQWSRDVGGPWSAVYRVINRKGEVVWIRDQAQPVIDDQGRQSYQGFYLDVTKQRQAQQALQETERYLRLIVRDAPSAIYALALDGTVRTWNPAAERLFGWNQQEVIGKPLPHIPPEGQEEFQGFLGVARAGGGFSDREVTRMRKDGSRISVSLSLGPIRDDTGGVSGILAFVIDISARERAERASQAKNEFLSRMSHELRTPLNTVLGFAQLMEMSDPRPDQLESLGHIQRSGRHLLDLIDEVLDISRIEAGRLRLSPEPVQAREAIRGAIDLVRPTAQMREIPVTFDDETCTAYVTADRQRLLQILLNLLTNAIKFNRERGAVSVWCETAGGRVRISVRDTGRGIPAGLVQQLFEPFERLDAEEIRIEGTGLGLALSLGLAQAMNGTIDVVSVPDEGSTFTIDLPEAYPSASDTGESARGQSLHALGTASPLKVLYVEDNLSNVRLMEHVMDKFGQVQLLTAMQGRIGVELAREHRPTVILLDLHLPDMPGELVLDRLMADEATRDIPVIVISADATERQRNRLLTKGAARFLTKPIDLKELEQLLRSMGVG